MLVLRIWWYILAFCFDPSAIQWVRTFFRKRMLLLKRSPQQTKCILAQPIWAQLRQYRQILKQNWLTLTLAIPQRPATVSLRLRKGMNHYNIMLLYKTMFPWVTTYASSRNHDRPLLCFCLHFQGLINQTSKTKTIMNHLFLIDFLLIPFHA